MIHDCIVHISCEIRSFVPLTCRYTYVHFLNQSTQFLFYITECMLFPHIRILILKDSLSTSTDKIDKLPLPDDTMMPPWAMEGSIFRFQISKVADIDNTVCLGSTNNLSLGRRYIYDPKQTVKVVSIIKLTPQVHIMIITQFSF